MVPNPLKNTIKFVENAKLAPKRVRNAFWSDFLIFFLKFFEAPWPPKIEPKLLKSKKIAFKIISKQAINFKTMFF